MGYLACGVAESLQVGIVWCVLMFSFEVTMGRAFGMSWSRIAAG